MYNACQLTKHELHVMFCAGAKLRCVYSVFMYRLVLKDYHQCGLLTLLVVWMAALFGIVYQYTYHER